MLAVSLIAFSLFKFVGDPVAQMVGQETSLEDQDRLRQRLGLNDPLVTQFTRFVGNLSRGEFGFSYRTRQTHQRDDSNAPASDAGAGFCFIANIFAGWNTGRYLYSAES